MGVSAELLGVVLKALARIHGDGLLSQEGFDAIVRLLAEAEKAYLDGVRAGNEEG